MGRYDLEEVEIEEVDLNTDTHFGQFAGGRTDQPKRLPIRRKDKWRQEVGLKAKSKRNNKKIQHRLKYNWQGE